MAVPLILGAASAIPGIIKGVQGIRQRNQAKKLRPEDFQYIPPALRENLASQRNIARSARMPGQAQAESNIRQQAAQAMNTAGAGSLADKIAAAQGIQAQSQQAMGNLATQGAQFQQQEQNELQDLMNQQAAYEEAGQRSFEQTKQGLLDAGSQNIFGGVSDVASGITGGAWQGAGGALSNMFGGRGNRPLITPQTDPTPFTTYQQGIASQVPNLGIQQAYKKTRSPLLGIPQAAY